MAKIAFFETEKLEENAIKKQLGRHQLRFFEKPISSADIAEIRDADAIAVFIYSEITEQILSKLPKLKFIATMSTGFDHLDLAACKKRGITVSNVPFYGENTVAEHTFALILALSRKIPVSIERTKKYDFTLDNLRGFDLKGKTLGIVGFGHIGQHIARMAKGFEMKVIAYDPNENLKLAKKFGVKYVTFDYLLAHSDIISLHAPYNKKTHHLINKKKFKFIKKKSFFFNLTHR